MQPGAKRRCKGWADGLRGPPAPAWGLHWCEQRRVVGPAVRKLAGMQCCVRADEVTGWRVGGAAGGSVVEGVGALGFGWP